MWLLPAEFEALRGGGMYEAARFGLGLGEISIRKHQVWVFVVSSRLSDANETFLQGVPITHPLLSTFVKMTRWETTLSFSEQTCMIEINVVTLQGSGEMV